jgi:hypothetical protein
MKQISKYFALLAVAAFVVIACQDNFSEADFVNNQLKNRNKQDSISIAKQIEAINASGQLLSYTLQVLDDKLPVSGVAVVMSNPPSGSTTPTLTATTDANGFATFKNVQIGANTFIVSKTGYYSATFIVDFGTIQSGQHYTQVSNNGITTIIPVKRTASNQVPIYASAAGGATAIIRGNVTIESDLTNTTAEIPQNITIKANLAQINNGNAGGSAGATAQGSQNPSSIVSYFFNTNAIGTATVDNLTGAYSMVVPAGADGRTINLIIPTVSLNQKIGFNRLNGQPVATQIGTIPAVFGPAFLAGNYDNIPQVPGAIATFPAPPAPGSGFKLAYTAVPRGFPVNLPANQGLQFTFGNITAQLTNKGSGYTASPTVTITGGGASTQATANTTLQGIATGITITAAGTGYSGTVSYQLQQSTDGGLNFANVSTVAFTSEAGNTPAPLAAPTLPTTGAGFVASNPVGTFGGVTNFRWLITNISPFGANPPGSGATASATFSATVDRVQILTPGTGYTSAPTITISAPASGTTATFVVQEFQTQWDIALDNSANTSPYRVMPAGINMVFSYLTSSAFTSNAVVDQFGNGTSSVIGALTVSGGNIVFKDPSRTYRTSGMSQNPPSTVVIPSVSTRASASVDVNSILGNAAFGQVTGLYNVVAGAGYDAPLTVTISAPADLPGTGARIDLSTSMNFDNNTKEYKWNGTPVTITSPGSGYQPFLNMHYVNNFNGNPQINAVQFTGTTSYTVRTGDVVSADIIYGSGRKTKNVN